MNLIPKVLMIRPVNFYFNAETALDNHFQQKITITDAHNKAVFEFDRMVNMLRSEKIVVEVVQDTEDPATPDSIFPNNWISFHQDNRICLYPMYAESRRLERKPDIIKYLNENYYISEIVDISGCEKNNKFLEGTGSMILDRQNQIAYASLSERTNPELFNFWCTKFNYQGVCFSAFDKQQLPIYHTNVLMCLGTSFVVICLDTITNVNEKELVLSYFAKTKKDVINISLEQMEKFAGNMLQVFSTENWSYIVMSETAYLSLTTPQINQLKKHAKLLYPAIPTIETLGGGSVRCMMAELYNKPKTFIN